MIERERYNEGVTDGINLGQAKEFVDNIEKLIKNLGLSLEAACKALGSSPQQYEDAKMQLK